MSNCDGYDNGKQLKPNKTISTIPELIFKHIVL